MIQTNYGQIVKLFTFLHKNKKPYNRCGCKAFIDVPGGHTTTLIYQWLKAMMFTLQIEHNKAFTIKCKYPTTLIFIINSKSICF